ncbi:MAG: helix-turn-helix transcriptional regulator [Novosphingobium sp.]|nr:helix-turn-helix transcriptional regulator [Novosphingobium sp.]
MQAPSLAGLTDKQLQTLELAAKGKTSKEVARELSISPYTVDQRIHAIKQKLGISSRRDLINMFNGICGQTAYEPNSLQSNQTPKQCDFAANPAELPPTTDNDCERDIAITVDRRNGAETKVAFWGQRKLNSADLLGAILSSLFMLAMLKSGIDLFSAYFP